MAKTAAFYTLGCKVSQYETEAIREAFLDRGFTAVPFGEPADVYVINTCTVTAESDAKSRKAIRRALRQNPDACVMVAGCYSQRDPETVAAIPGVAYVTGSDGKMRIPAIAEELLIRRQKGDNTPVVSVSDIEEAAFEPMAVREGERTRAYIKIEDGCECRCTYCAIPAARGGVRSKAPDDVIAEVRCLCENGTKEVVLTGIETASYGRDFSDSYRLIDLLEKVERETPVERIRLGSLTPELFRGDFIARASRLSRLTPHFHLSIQSGSNAVLARMRRRYRREQALDGIRRLRAAFPGLMLTADMIVGFPGETEEDFLDTLSFAEEAEFLHIHVFPYSRREGTPAAAFPDQIPEAEKHRRAAELSALGDRLKTKNLSGVINQGKPLSVVFETREKDGFHGHSASYIEVVVESTEDLHGELRDVLPLRQENGILYGELLETVDM